MISFTILLICFFVVAAFAGANFVYAIETNQALNIFACIANLVVCVMLTFVMFYVIGFINV